MNKAVIIDKSVINIFWSYFSFASVKVLNLATLVILARFLTPAEFGLMAICLVAQGMFEIVSRFGLGASLISADPDDRAMEDSVFYFSAASSLVMTVALWVGSPAIAAFFEMPPLVDMLRVTCVALLIDGLSTVPNTLLQRKLRFRAKLVPDVTRGLVKGVTGISLALLGFGVWSLVYAYVLGAIANAIALFIIHPWRPIGAPRRAQSLQAARFGSHLLGSELISIFSRNFDIFLIGKILGASALGVYNLALRIPELLIKSFNMLSGGVAHPILAGMRDDEAALRSYFYGCLRYFALVTFPAGVGLAVVSDPLVRVLYTPVWYDMIFPMQCLAIAFAIGTVNILPGSIYKAINKPHYLLQTSLIMLPVTISALWVAAPYGIEAVALTKMTIPILTAIPQFYVLNLRVGVKLAPSMRALVPGLGCAAAGGAAGFGALQIGIAPVLLELVVVSAAVGLAYLAALRFFGPEVFVQLRRMVLAKLKR